MEESKISDWINSITLLHLLKSGEPLHEDLKPYINNGGMFVMLKHPLVFAVPYVEQMHSLYNKQYEHKKNRISDYLKKKNYEGYIFLYERPYRLMAFLNIADKLKGKQYWEILADIWTDSENIWQNKKTYKMLFGENLESKKYFMSKEDRKYFDSLPEQVVVYRGYLQGKNKTGFSYTLNKERAEWFANRFSGDGKVYERTVRKDKIVAYTNRRDEQEVIILS